MNVDGEVTVAFRGRNSQPSAGISTTLESIRNSGGCSDILISSITMIEELDRVILSGQERIAVSILFAFLSSNLNTVMNVDSISVIHPLGLDWYTSATCSDIRWLRNVIRDPRRYPGVRMTTDISSILGSFFLGNLSMISDTNTGEHGRGTVRMDISTSRESEIIM